jgi:hypothetical protein
MNNFFEHNKLMLTIIYIFCLVIFSLMVLVAIVYTFKFIGYAMSKSEVIGTGVTIFLTDLAIGIPIMIAFTDF